MRPELRWEHSAVNNARGNWSQGGRALGPHRASESSCCSYKSRHRSGVCGGARAGEELHRRCTAPLHSGKHCATTLVHVNAWCKCAHAGADADAWSTPSRSGCQFCQRVQGNGDGDASVVVTKPGSCTARAHEHAGRMSERVSMRRVVRRHPRRRRALRTQAPLQRAALRHSGAQARMCDGRSVT